MYILEKSPDDKVNPVDKLDVDWNLPDRLPTEEFWVNKVPEVFALTTAQIVKVPLGSKADNEADLWINCEPENINPVADKVGIAVEPVTMVVAGS